MTRHPCLGDREELISPMLGGPPRPGSPLPLAGGRGGPCLPPGVFKGTACSSASPGLSTTCAVSTLIWDPLSFSPMNPQTSEVGYFT